MKQNYDKTEAIPTENIKGKNNKRKNENIYNISLTVLIVSLMLLVKRLS